MPLPTASDVHVDSMLTNISVAFLQQATNFIARQVFPNVPVMKQSDRYFVYNRGDMNRDEAKKRAPGTESAGSGYRLDNTPNYFCDVWAFHKDVPAQIVSNSDAAHDPFDVAAAFTMQKLMIRHEAEFASTFMAAGVWDNSDTGVATSAGSGEVIQWSDDVNSDPIGNIRDAKDTILEATGFEPNTLVLGKKVFSALVDHPDIVDRVKYASSTTENPATVNERTLAALFGLDRVMISKAVENTAAEGATEAGSFIVGKKALLCYATPTPGIMVPTAGYNFSWQGFLNQTNEFGIATKRFEMRELEAERVEAQMALDMKVIASEMGYFWNTIVA